MEIVFNSAKGKKDSSHHIFLFRKKQETPTNPVDIKRTGELERKEKSKVLIALFGKKREIRFVGKLRRRRKWADRPICQKGNRNLGRSKPGQDC